MKKGFITLLVILLALPVFSQEHLKFNGIPIDGKLSSFISALKEKGMSVAPYSTASEPNLLGSFAGIEDCYIGFGVTDDETVCRVVIVTPMRSSWRSVKKDYDLIKETVIAKYDGEIKEYEYFEEPHKSGDGYEIQALSLDKAVFETYDMMEEGGVKIKIRASQVSYGKAFVTIIYEDSINTAKYIKENRQQISDDVLQKR